MRKYFVAFFFLSFLTLTSGQGIDFFHGSWEEAVIKANQEDKIIFVDAFTTWCGPCKRMAATTFTDAAVGDFYNANFINLKIDMEKEMGLEFKRKFPVSAYPTLFFIDGSQEVVQKVVGGKGPAEFIALGESIIGKYDRSKKYEAAYLAGDRSYQLIYDYIAALNKAGKPSIKIANDYLATQEDLETPDNLRFILEAASQVDCHCFELLEKYKSDITGLTSSEAVNTKIREACSNTIKRAIEFESPDLIAAAASAMKKHIPGEAEFFLSKSEVQYALALHEVDRLPELVNNHVRKHIKNDADGLHQLALDLHKYTSDNKACLEVAIGLAEKAAKEEDVKYVATYAQLKHKAGAKQEALEILDNAIRKMGEEESKELQLLKALRNKIENG